MYGLIETPLDHRLLLTGRFYQSGLTRGLEQAHADLLGGMLLALPV